jgi:hypothetical protein
MNARIFEWPVEQDPPPDAPSRLELGIQREQPGREVERFLRVLFGCCLLRRAGRQLRLVDRWRGSPPLILISSTASEDAVTRYNGPGSATYLLLDCLHKIAVLVDPLLLLLALLPLKLRRIRDWRVARSPDAVLRRAGKQSVPILPRVTECRIQLTMRALRGV